MAGDSTTRKASEVLNMCEVAGAGVVAVDEAGAPQSVRALRAADATRDANAVCDAEAARCKGATPGAGVARGAASTRAAGARALYLDCASGIAGDMFVAALLDLGGEAAERVLREVLASLPMDGFGVEVARVKKSGIDCCDFNVVLDEVHDGHDHDMDYLHGAGHTPHDHDHDHDHSHGHADHHHAHRGLADIVAIIDAAAMTPAARAFAKKTFRILAEAEARAHGVPLEQVHFHEVGAVDSIVDIVAAAVLVDCLRVERTIVCALTDGHGTIRCQHGIIPVPVPATLNICTAHGLPLSSCDIEGELVTPTGAAIVAALEPELDLPERYAVRRVGLGAGKRAYERPSILRAMFIEDLGCAYAPAFVSASAPARAGEGGEPSFGAASTSVGPSSSDAAACTEEGSRIGLGAAASDSAALSSNGIDDAGETLRAASRSAQPYSDETAAPNTIVKLECDIDDCSSEVLAYAAERLRAAGAREVHWLPIFCKKGRPAYQLQVICAPEDIDLLQQIIFTETTTIGIRRQVMERTVLERTFTTVKTPWGKVRCKALALPDDDVRYVPEYEDCAELARCTGLPLQDILRSVSR